MTGDTPYLPRVIDVELQRRLASIGAVIIEGPKACGKTASARQVAASEVLFDVDTDARRAAAIDPALILDGPVPRLFDEWQLAPEIWNHIRRAVDDRRQPGQFILTGSAVPTDDVTRHTGAGRIARVRLRPMSLFESGHSSGAISMAELFEGGHVRCPDPGLQVSDLADLVVAGGWPGLHDRSSADASTALRDYLEEIRRTDVRRVDGTKRDPERVGRLLRSLARNVSTYAAATTLAADTGGADGALDDDTVRDYLSALERLMIVEDQPAWAPHLRSKSVLRGSAKRHFVDPSLAVAALRTGTEHLLGDLNLFGLLFESLVVRDLRVYAQAAGGRVLQYRDNTGLEIDAVVEIADGRWAAFEVKLGAGLAAEGAAALHRFADRVDTDRSGPPAVLGVIVGSGFGYVRDDGIAVIPIGALAP